MTRIVERLLSSTLVTALVAFAGCGVLSPDRREFVIRIDSIGGPSAVSRSTSFQQSFYGFVGSDGCYRFKEFRVTRGATGADITVVGEHLTGGGACTQAVVFLRGEPLTIDQPISDPFTLRVHQPDGAVLTRVIRAQ
jgi:hypothetical protein